MNNKTKEAIRGYIKAIENALEEDGIKYGLSDPILRYEDTAKPLQLRFGGRYLAGDGTEVKIVRRNNDLYFPFDGDNCRRYTRCGKFFLNGIPSEHDLIKEL